MKAIGLGPICASMLADRGTPNQIVLRWIPSSCFPFPWIGWPITITLTTSPSSIILTFVWIMRLRVDLHHLPIQSNFVCSPFLFFVCLFLSFFLSCLLALGMCLPIFYLFHFASFVTAPSSMKRWALYVCMSMIPAFLLPHYHLSAFPWISAVLLPCQVDTPMWASQPRLVCLGKRKIFCVGSFVIPLIVID